MPGIDIWFKRLRDDDPAIREQAICALEDIGDVAALNVLAMIFAGDPDPDIRQLARKAGKSIYFNQIRQEQQERGPSLVQRQQAGEILTRAAKTKKQRRL